jgi:hypothetical protein
VVNGQKEITLRPNRLDRSFDNRLADPSVHTKRHPKQLPAGMLSSVQIHNENSLKGGLVRHLKKKDIPIFLLYGLCHLTAWLTSLSLLYHTVLNGLSLKEIGYDKPCLLAISIAGIIVFAWRFPFLRPFPSPKGRRLFWRICQFIFGSLAVMCFGPFLMGVILMDAKPILMFNTALGTVCFALCAWLIGKFILPTVK